MGYDESLYIRHKKGEYIINECGWHINRSLKELTNNFFKAINSSIEWNENDFWNDFPPEAEYAEHWTKIDDGDIPIWTERGQWWAGGLLLTTTKGIEAFLKANGYKDIIPEDIECIGVGWDC